MDPILSQWAQCIRDAASGNPLRLRGGGSKDFYGNPATGELLDTRDYRGIVSYEPTELVITARCGTPLAELEATLAAHNQVLAFEPPHFGAATSATVGGAVAAGLAGPRRLQAGPLRDFVLGARLLDGRGQVVDFGGQVMKNVAGYDVSRLLAGSLGILGVIAEVSLKVLPKPMAETTLAIAASETDALRLVGRWRGQPLPVAATAWYQGRLQVRLCGASAAVAAASRQLGGDHLDAAESVVFWRRLRDQQLPFFSAGEAPLWRLAVPADVAALDLGETLIEWSGGQRWLRGEFAADQLRATAAALGGSATLFRGAGATPAFAPPAPALLQLHRRLKAQFDPAGIFNPGRLYPQL
ncbi:MAG: glycolate oxidase subunit GlcE [Porticoccaceae bacterium]|jgi:glycolate oxidase FAD binding subunit